jgi:hypothetical protein
VGQALFLQGLVQCGLCSGLKGSCYSQVFKVQALDKT